MSKLNTKAIYRCKCGYEWDKFPDGMRVARADTNHQVKRPILAGWVSHCYGCNKKILILADDIVVLTHLNQAKYEG